MGNLGSDSIDWSDNDSDFPEATNFFYIIAGLCVLTFIIGVIAIIKACNDKRKLKKQVKEL